MTPPSQSFGVTHVAPLPTFNQTPNRPFVLVNMAISADGKIATTNRAVSNLGSPRDQRRLYEIRATADAIMSGARTLDRNPVVLGSGGKRYENLRKSNGLKPQAIRIVVSGRATLSPDSEIFRHRFSPILLLVGNKADSNALKLLSSKATSTLQSDGENIDWNQAMRWLFTEWGIQRLLCEGGGRLNAELFRLNLVDQLHLTICPKIVGGHYAPTIADGVFPSNLADSTRFKLATFRRIGDEAFLTYRRAKVLES